MKYLFSLATLLARYLLGFRNRHFLGLDVVILSMTPTIAFMLRMESPMDLVVYRTTLLWIAGVFLAVKLYVFYGLGLYNRYWKYASVGELAKISIAVLAAVGVQLILFFMVLRPLGWVDPSFPRSVPFIEGMLALLYMGASRYSVRMSYMLIRQSQHNGQGKRVLVFGAGEAGIMMVNEMRSNPQLHLSPVGFIDDNPDKRGVRIRGLNVLGNRHDIPDIVRHTEADLVVIAIPMAPGKEVREVAEICRSAGVETKTVPGVYELLDDTVTIQQLRPVQVEDLLRRAPVQADMQQVANLLRGSRVLVTGAGGSIGSELCRQILPLKPAAIILLGHGENSIFHIEAELKRRIAGSLQDLRSCEIIPVIADIRDEHRLKQVFDQHQPAFVFHAAAHKHVPLMESNVEDAISNNIVGTRQLVNCASRAGVKRFVLISTDKAVGPTNIMGTTKRVAELLVQDKALQTGQAFLAVRFGNVLGSRGSVVQIFRDQISRGGPITVTHPEIRRFFMTIPEAVHLVLQAAAMGRGSEIFALDMGEPVLVLDLAQDLVRLSGLTLGQDIDIVYTGLRPGEKMTEVLFGDEETVLATDHEKILVCHQKSGQMEDGLWSAETHQELYQWVDHLAEVARQGDTPAAIQMIKKMVPTYRQDERHGTSALGTLLSAEGDGSAWVDQ